MNRRGLMLGAASALAAPRCLYGSVSLPQPRAVLRSAWWDDSYARGSYSHLGLTGGRADRVALSRPIGPRLVLAGEATEPDHPSTVHGAILSGRRAAEQILEMGVAHVVIAGAGVAGLAAAEWLLHAECRVEMVEARDRIGGRVVSDRSLGFAADLGASWIHGRRGNPVTELAQSANLSLMRSNWEESVTRDRNGRVVDMPAWLEAHSMANLDYADDLDHLSERALEEGVGFDGPDVLIKGGYDQILRAFELDGLELHLNAPINEIEHDAREVSIKSTAGQFSAEAAIVTLPLGVLQADTVQFSPALPASVQMAVSRLKMGSLEKVFLAYDDVFWDRDAEVILAADARDGAFAAFVNLVPLTGEAAVMALNGGDYARSLAAYDSVELGQIASAALAALYP
ncbi:FAD-dependent oxidoreductase [Rhodobacteraceae bacterium XHP0102]|nr:FAD-dependent oxidoreductase [Rhodobacteraceae bacterium XHP0102]